MHTIPARLSPPPREPPPPCTSKGACPAHAYYSSDPVHCLRITYDYTASDYMQLSSCISLTRELYCNQQSFIYPTDEKASMHLICRTILSYQVKFFWSMTNPVPSSDTVMTKRFAPMTILWRFVVVRYTSQDTAFEDRGYRSIQCLIGPWQGIAHSL